MRTLSTCQRCFNDPWWYAHSCIPSTCHGAWHIFYTQQIFIETEKWWWEKYLCRKSALERPEKIYSDVLQEILGYIPLSLICTQNNTVREISGSYLGVSWLQFHFIRKKLNKNYNTDNISKVLCSFPPALLGFHFSLGHRKVYFNFHGHILKKKSWDINVIHLLKNTETNVAI